MVNQKFLEAYAQLSSAYALQIEQCLSAMDSAFASMATMAVGQGLTAVRLQAHTLAGSAPTFGYAGVGLAAAELEDFLIPLIARGGALSRSENERLQTLVGRLRLAAAHA
jgi:HPt (histidine-containing phosphotransfer) domain-containing protein